MSKSFESMADYYFSQLEASELRTGHSSTNTLARLAGDEGGSGEFSSSKHRVLDRGMPTELKLMNLAYRQMLADEPEQAAILRLAYGGVYVDGKKASWRKRAAMAGVSSGSLKTKSKNALVNWCEFTRILSSRQKRLNVR